MANTRKASAAKAEARREAVEFEYDGVTYEIPPTNEWPVDVIEAYEDGKVASTVRALLGPEQWATFKSRPRTVDDLTALFEALQKAMGLEGN